MKTMTMSSVLLLCLAFRPVSAQEVPPLEVPPLGQYHFTLGFGSMIMQHVTFETDDAGIHLGIAGYKHVGSSWYMGLELGAGESMMVFGDNSEITMWELNAKRVFDLGSNFRADLGGGLSYNHVTYDGVDWFGTEGDFAIDDWVPGVQALGNLHFKMGQFLLGAHVKYMLTGDVEGVQEAEGLEEGWDYSNLTTGLQLGFLVH
jgi:hypothetical protein